MTKRDTAASGRRRSFVRIPTDTALELIEAVTNAGCAIQSHGAAIISQNSENGRWVGEEDAALDAAVMQSALAGLEKVEDVLNAAISSNGAPVNAGVDVQVGYTGIHIDDFPAPQSLDDVLKIARFKPSMDDYANVISVDGRRARVIGNESLVKEIGDAWSASLNPSNVGAKGWASGGGEEGYLAGWQYVFDKITWAHPSTRIVVLRSIVAQDVDPKVDSPSYQDGISLGVNAAKDWIYQRARDLFEMDGPQVGGDPLSAAVEMLKLAHRAELKKQPGREPSPAAEKIRQLIIDIDGLRESIDEEAA